MILQFIMAAFGLSAAYMAMVSKRARVNRLAPFVGLAGQPAWLYVTWQASQWGMFAICCAYTLVYIRGVAASIKVMRS